MKCLIVANGNIENIDLLKGLTQTADVVVCADGGAKHLKRLDIFPDILVGDLDSIEEPLQRLYEQNSVSMIAYPRKKNASDTELAVFWAIEQGAAEIVLTGVTGARLDHTMANIFLLKTILKNKIACRIVDDHNEIYLLCHDSVLEGGNGNRESLKEMEEGLCSLSIGGKPGDLLSIIPITDKVTDITLKGLEYPLYNAVLKLGSSIGISNVFAGETARISLKEGAVLVTKSCD